MLYVCAYGAVLREGVREADQSRGELFDVLLALVAYVGFCARFWEWPDFAGRGTIGTGVDLHFS